MIKGPGPGRPKGAKNITSLARVADMLASKSRHPVEELLHLLPELEPKDRATVWMALLRFIEAPAIPKRDNVVAALEVSYKVVDDNRPVDEN
jgi:hypothetical protein